MTKEQQYWEDAQEALSRIFDRCEEIDPQSGYDMLEDIQFVRGFINKHKPQTEPSDDCIRRAKALEVIEEMDIPEDMSSFEIKSHIGVEIGTLPPVTSTRMKGKWINILPCTTNFQDQIIYQCVCDRCSSIAYFRKMCGKLVGANLCPVCGAKMQEVEE